MYKIKDFQAGEKVYGLPSIRNINAGRDFPTMEEFEVLSVGEDKIQARRLDDSGAEVELIESVTYGVIVDDHEIKKCIIFKSDEEARDYYEQDTIEKWFRIKFGQIPESEFSYEQMLKAQKILEGK